MRPAVRLAPGRAGPAGLAPLILAILCAAFLAGAVLGAFTSSAAAGEAAAAIGEDGQVYGYDTFLEHLFGCAKYHVLVLLFATSVFGAVLIPAALAFRGFALACSAAGIAAAYPGRRRCRSCGATTGRWPRRPLCSWPLPWSALPCRRSCG